MCSNPEKWHTKEDITIITMVHRHCFKTKKAARTITKSDGGAEGGENYFSLCVKADSGQIVTLIFFFKLQFDAT